MTADLAERLEARAAQLCGPDSGETIALLREAASALRSRGDAVAVGMRAVLCGDAHEAMTSISDGAPFAQAWNALDGKAFRTPATPASAPVSNEDIHLAAQMLTWGMQEGLTSKQYDEVIAHQRKLLAATTPPTSTKA